MPRDAAHGTLAMFLIIQIFYYQKKGVDAQLHKRNGAGRIQELRSTSAKYCVAMPLISEYVRQSHREANISKMI